jgi:hypothetical protein
LYVSLHNMARSRRFILIIPRLSDCHTIQLTAVTRCTVSYNVTLTFFDNTLNCYVDFIVNVSLWDGEGEAWFRPWALLVSEFPLETFDTFFVSCYTALHKLSLCQVCHCGKFSM